MATRPNSGAAIGAASGSTYMVQQRQQHIVGQLTAHLEQQQQQPPQLQPPVRTPLTSGRPSADATAPIPMSLSDFGSGSGKGSPGIIPVEESYVSDDHAHWIGRWLRSGDPVGNAGEPLDTAGNSDVPLSSARGLINSTRSVGVDGRLALAEEEPPPRTMQVIIDYPPSKAVAETYSTGVLKGEPRYTAMATGAGSELLLAENSEATTTATMLGLPRSPRSSRPSQAQEWSSAEVQQLPLAAASAVAAAAVAAAAAQQAQSQPVPAATTAPVTSPAPTPAPVPLPPRASPPNSARGAAPDRNLVVSAQPWVPAVSSPTLFARRGMSPRSVSRGSSPGDSASSTPRRSQESRHRELYADALERQRRKKAQEADQKAGVKEVSRKKSTGSRRKSSYDKPGLLARTEEHLRRKAEMQEIAKEDQRQREEEELQECTFKPCISPRSREARDERDLMYMERQLRQLAHKQLDVRARLVQLESEWAQVLEERRALVAQRCDERARLLKESGRVLGGELPEDQRRLIEREVRRVLAVELQMEETDGEFWARKRVLVETLEGIEARAAPTLQVLQRMPGGDTVLESSGFTPELAQQMQDKVVPAAGAPVAATALPVVRAATVPLVTGTAPVVVKVTQLLGSQPAVVGGSMSSPGIALRTNNLSGTIGGGSATGTPLSSAVPSGQQSKVPPLPIPPRTPPQPPPQALPLGSTLYMEAAPQVSPRAVATPIGASMGAVVGSQQSIIAPPPPALVGSVRVSPPSVVLPTGSSGRRSIGS